MTWRPKGVDEKEWQVVQRILEPYLPACIFGSRVWGRPGPFSDLDVALVVRPLPAGTMEHLRGELDDSDLPFIVDVSILHELPEAWQSLIAAKGHRLDKQGPVPP